MCALLGLDQLQSGTDGVGGGVGSAAQQAVCLAHLHQHGAEVVGLLQQSAALLCGLLALAQLHHGADHLIKTGVVLRVDDLGSGNIKVTGGGSSLALSLVAHHDDLQHALGQQLASGLQDAGVIALGENDRERTREATAVRAKRTTESRAARGAEMSLGQKLKAIHGKVRKAVHESRERNFPESNGVAGQLLLLLCGLAAYWGALGREKLRLARRSHIRRTGGTSRAAKWRRKKYYPLAFGGAALVIAATAVFVSRYTFGTTVIYEGQALDTVASELEAKRVTASIADITSETLGKTFTFSDSSIQYTSGLVERSAVVDRAELEEELTDEMGLVTQGYSLYINDELIGSTQYEGALEGLLDQLKESYLSEDTLTVDFVEDVRIAKGYVPTESIMNLGQIAEILNSTKEGEVTYTVVKGDTWSGIANSHGMTTKELLAINPDFDINRLQIGDELTLSNAVPYLTVMVTERQNYVEDIQYDITYTDDATMYKGDYKVLSKGVYGTADVVADITYVNGEETSAPSSPASRSPSRSPSSARRAPKAPRAGIPPAAPLADERPHRRLLRLPQHRHPRRVHQP